MAIYIYNSDELAGIEKACILTARVLDEIEAVIKAGATTHDIDSLAKDIIVKSGGKPAFLGYKGFPASTCISINEVVVHGIPSRDVRLKDGDIVGIDIGVYYNGFFGDSARSYAIGKVSGEAELLLKTTKDALYSGISKCVEGNRISDISNAIETAVTKFGFYPVREFIGHGIGKNLHEEPSIPNYGDPGKGPRIKNGMVFAIEPMINIGTYEVDVKKDGWTVVTRDRSLSAHFEHTVCIIDGFAKILTRGKDFY